MKNDHLCTHKSKNDEYDPPTEQAIQHLQGGAEPGVSARVLNGARGEARDGAGLLQVHGSQRRGWQGLLH